MMNQGNENGGKEGSLKRKLDSPSADNATYQIIKRKSHDVPCKSMVSIKKVDHVQPSSEKEEDLDSLYKGLLEEIKVSEERVRKLKMVKMYREKNNLEELQTLIEKWRGVSQQAVEDLLGLHPAPQPSMAELLSHLQIDFDLIQFDQEEGSFQ